MNQKTIHIGKFVMIALKKKKFITKYIRFFFYSTVFLSVTSLSHISDEWKNLLEYDSKEENLKFHFFYMFSGCHVLIQK